MLKVEGEITVKNSVRIDETKLQAKKFVKWLAEGLHLIVNIEGNPKVIQHMTSPLA